MAIPLCQLSWEFVTTNNFIDKCKTALMSRSLNLLIIGFAIIIVVLIYENQSADSFVGMVPNVPIGGYQYPPFPGYFYTNTIPNSPPNFPNYQSGPINQPIIYPNQMYPAKIPYYDDTINQTGKVCGEANDCGVLGACQGVVCKVKRSDNTVFDLRI
mgnify:CR=1 FL=1